MPLPPRLLTQTIPPASEPVTLAQAKLFLRVDGTDDDALITDLITAARLAAESHTRLSLLTQSWKLAFDHALENGTFLPKGPVQSVSSVIAYDAYNTPTVLGGGYWLNAPKNRLMLAAPVFACRIEVAYACGFGDAADAVPGPITQGMLLHIGALYDQRGGQAAIPPAALDLYNPFREVGL
jgi:uncharacterized phiE125 gp8 family phage protein